MNKMLLWIRFFGAALLLLAPLNAYPQAALSLGASGYNGLNAAAVNPARISHNFTPWGIHLPAIGANLQNNGLRSGYFSGLAALISGNYSIGIVNQISQQSANPPDILLQNLELEQTNFHGQASVQVLGAYVQLGYHSLGVGIGNRAFFNLTGLSRGLMKHYSESILFEPLKNQAISSNGIDFQAATFSEVQLAWSWRFLHHYNRSASIGAVLKPVFGYRGVHAQFDELNYTVTNTDSFKLNAFSGGYANALKQPYFQGRSGLGIDIGFEYVEANPNGPNNKVRNRKRIDKTPFGRKLKKSIRPIPNHYWRMGVSLLDVGSIRVNAPKYLGAAKDVTASVADEALLNGNGAESYFLNVIASQGQLQTDTSGFALGLATALGIQYDVWILGKYYFHASLVQRLPMFGDYSLKRLNQLMIAPRYESPWLEVGLPLTLYEYEQLQLGIWARWGPITVGTDRLGELIGFRRMVGADAYVSLNLLPFWK